MCSQPLGCGLWSAARNPRYVVHGIADQCKVVGDLIRPYPELLDHTIRIHNRIRHGVDQRYVLIDQLRHVLVAGGDDGRYARFTCLSTERANDIVGLDSLDHQ